MKKRFCDSVWKATSLQNIKKKKKKRKKKKRNSAQKHLNKYILYENTVVAYLSM